MQKKSWTKEEMKLISLEMLKGNKSISQICKEYGICESLAYKWKNKALEGIDAAFDKRQANGNDFEAEKNKFLRIIGEQTLVIDTLKKIAN